MDTIPYLPFPLFTNDEGSDEKQTNIKQLKFIVIDNSFIRRTHRILLCGRLQMSYKVAIPLRYIFVFQQELT